MFLLASTTHVQGRGIYILTRAEVRTKHHGGEEMLLTTWPPQQMVGLGAWLWGLLLRPASRAALMLLGRWEEEA